MKKWLAVPAQYKFVCKLPDEVPQRCLPEDWAEIDHLTLPLVKEGTVLTYSPDDLKRLLAAAPDTFIPCVALAAFAGMRSAEIERIGWDNIRLVTKTTRTGLSTWKLGSPSAHPAHPRPEPGEQPRTA